jgi:hypothetical protein
MIDRDKIEPQFFLNDWVIPLAGIMINILRGAAGVGSDWLLTFSLTPDL